MVGGLAEIVHLALGRDGLGLLRAAVDVQIVRALHGLEILQRKLPALAVNDGAGGLAVVVEVHTHAQKLVVFKGAGVDHGARAGDLEDAAGGVDELAAVGAGDGIALLGDPVVVHITAAHLHPQRAGAVQQDLRPVAADLGVEDHETGAGLDIEQVIGAAVALQAAVQDLAAEKAHVVGAVGIHRAVGALADDRARRSDAAAVHGGDAQRAAAVEVAAADVHVLAVDEVQHAARAVARRGGVARGEGDDVHVRAPVEGHDVRVARLGDDAALLVVADDVQVVHVADVELVSVAAVQPGEMLGAVLTAVARGLGEIVLAVGQLDHAVAADGGEQLVHVMDDDLLLRDVLAEDLGDVSAVVGHRRGRHVGGGQAGLGVGGQDGAVPGAEGHAAAGEQQDNDQCQGETRPAFVLVLHDLQ